MDNPKLKKLDRKRVAMSQKHEVDYVKKIAKEIINSNNGVLPSPDSIKRLAKAFIKLAK